MKQIECKKSTVYMNIYLPYKVHAWLNELVIFFRKEYDNNVSHTSYFVHMNPPNLNTKIVDILRTAHENSKEYKNFKKLFLYLIHDKKVS